MGRSIKVSPQAYKMLLQLQKLKTAEPSDGPARPPPTISALVEYMARKELEALQARAH